MNQTKELLLKVSRFIQFFSMIEAHVEIAGIVLKDTDVIASFMGSGASDNLLVKDFRELKQASKGAWSAKT